MCDHDSSFDTPLTSSSVEVAPIEIIVGPDRRIFYVHEKLLRTHSPFFVAALNKSWEEGAERRVTLPEAESAAFKGYAHWLYDTGDIPAPVMTETANSAAFKEHAHWLYNKGDLSGAIMTATRADTALLNSEIMLYVKMYALGEQIIDSCFQNAVINAIMASEKRNTVSGQRWPYGRTSPSPEDDIVDYVYKSTPADSPLRRLVVDLHISMVGAFSIEKEGPAETNHDFALDLSAKLLRLHRLTLDGKSLRDMYKHIYTGNPCSYHKHGRDDKRCSQIAVL